MQLYAHAINSCVPETPSSYYRVNQQPELHQLLDEKR